MSQKGNPSPNRGVTAFLAVMTAGIAVVILMMGGSTALSGLQNLVTISVLPFAIIMVIMCISLVKELRNDPMMIREHYQKTAIENAVRYGIEEHGDNFELSVEAVHPDLDRGVGNDFDSTAEELTEWYARTDEDVILSSMTMSRVSTLILKRGSLKCLWTPPLMMSLN